MNPDIHLQTYAVTGAGGYVGSSLVSWLRKRGHKVYELRHHGTLEDNGKLVRRYTLEKGLEPADLAGIDVLVHCAYDFRWTEWRDIERVNVHGSVRLFEAAASAGVKRMVFISSLSAFPGCRSRYGQAKIAIEAAVTRFGGIAVRPGLIWGGTTGGMVGNLRSALASLPMVPAISGKSSKMYLVHIDDLCALLEAVSRREATNPSEPLVAAAEDGMTFLEILRTLSQSSGRRAVFVPVPWRAAWLGLRAAERLGLRLPFRSDSVLGLVYTGPPPDFSTSRTYPVSFRAFTGSTVASSCAAS